MLICLYSGSQALSENGLLVYTLRNPLVYCLNLGFITGNPASEDTETLGTPICFRLDFYE